jgi:hypothetical protein
MLINPRYLLSAAELALTLTHVKMTLELTGNSTEFSFSDIKYNANPSANLFDPQQLQNLAKQPFLERG